MTRSRQRSDQMEEIARKLEIVLAELASLRILLAAHGISTPPPLHEDYLTVQRFAAMNHISPEGVLSRIRRGKLRAEKRGGRWWVKCTVAQHSRAVARTVMIAEMNQSEIRNPAHGNDLRVSDAALSELDRTTNTPSPDREARCRCTQAITKCVGAPSTWISDDPPS